MEGGMNGDALDDLRDLLEEASVRRYRMELLLRDGERLVGPIRLDADGRHLDAGSRRIAL